MATVTSSSSSSPLTLYLNLEPADPSWDLSWLDDISVSDNGRYINGFLNKIPFSMERLKDFVKQLRPRDRLFAIDISSAYHHVMIAPRFRTLLGFTFEGVDYV